MTQQFHSWVYIWEKTKTLIQKATCTPVFIAALFITAKIWKQPKCPSTDEWIKEMWYTYATEYYSAMKKNEILPFATTWMDLEGIMLSEVSQTETNMYDITYMWNFKKIQQTSEEEWSRLTDAENKLVVASGGGGNIGQGN